jgi:hypothetical protein
MQRAFRPSASACPATLSAAWTPSSFRCHRRHERMNNLTHEQAREEGSTVCMLLDPLRRLTDEEGKEAEQQERGESGTQNGSQLGIQRRSIG